MKRTIFYLAVLLLFSSCAAQQSTESGYVDPDRWELLWEDQFDYSSRDELLKVWDSANGPTTHTLCSRWPENVEVSDGTVRLVNHKESRGGQDWTAGSIWTKQQFQYGYFECRYKYAAASGTNNSFWLMSHLDEPAPAVGKFFELDINEGHYPHQVNVTIHNWSDTLSGGGHPSSGKSYEYPDIDFSADFHVFGMAWTEDELVFYLDGQEIRREANEFAYSRAPVLLSMAVLKWAGEVTDAVDGTYMEVDYVKVYKERIK